VSDRVVTSEDVRKVIPEPYYGPAFHDQPILAIDKVHYVGEPVAVVIAADPHIAEEAVQLIVPDYEELPAIYDEIEAADNKTLVHEELRPAGTFAVPRPWSGQHSAASFAASCAAR
jgi:CO/xanthine dehydrogenase Mo-binding subunit